MLLIRKFGFQWLENVGEITQTLDCNNLLSVKGDRQETNI